MKKTLLFVMALLCSLSISAEVGDRFTDEETGLTFEVIGEDEAQVVGFDGSTDDVEVPDFVFDEDWNYYDVTAIGDGAFKMKMSLSRVVLSKGITTIGKQAFYFCPALEEIELPETLTTIGGQAFQMCSKLAEVVIPAGVETIGASAFQGGLERLTLMGAPSEVGAKAFRRSNGSALTEVVLMSTVPPTFDVVSAFGLDESALSATTLVVPAGTADAYQAATGWSAFTIEENVTDGISRICSTVSEPWCEAYDLQGRRADSLRHGLLISRGHKLLR